MDFKQNLEKKIYIKVSRLNNKTVSHFKPLHMAKKVGKIRNDTWKRSNPGCC